MKSILFVCNWERTESINLVAEKLRRLTPRALLHAIVHDHTARSIIDINLFDSVLDLASAESVNRENLLSESHCGAIISRDRFMDENSKSRKLVQSWYAMIWSHFEFIESAIVIGEVSWAAEELVFTYAKHRGWDFFTPSVSRVFDRRWFLAEGMSEATMIAPMSETCGCENFVETDVLRPAYFWKAMHDLSFLNRLRVLSLNKLISYTKSRKRRSLLKAKIAKEFSFFTRFFTWKNLNHRTFYNKKIIVFPMHVQPEASVDYLAPQYRDQYKVVDDLVRLMPDDCILAVKDHPANIHEFSLTTKLRLLRSDKVAYLHPDFNVVENYEAFTAGIVISGSIAAQLAEKGVPSFTLIPMFFNSHPLCNYLDLDGTLSFDTLGCGEDDIDLLAINQRYKDEIFRNTLSGFSFSTNEYGFSDPLYINSLAGELYARIESM